MLKAPAVFHGDVVNGGYQRSIVSSRTIANAVSLLKQHSLVILSVNEESHVLGYEILR